MVPWVLPALPRDGNAQNRSRRAFSSLHQSTLFFLPSKSCSSPSLQAPDAAFAALSLRAAARSRSRHLWLWELPLLSMRKKVIIEAMADGVVTNLQAVSHPPTNLESHIKDFHPSVKRLSQAARATAQRLHAITYLQRSPSVMTELVPEVYALAAILCDLNDDLLLGSNFKATDWTPMWTSEHHKNLTGAIDECDGALKAVFRAVQIADEESRIVAISKKANNYIEHLLAEGSHALESVVRCSRLVSKTKVIVRHTLLSQTEIL